MPQFLLTWLGTTIAIIITATVVPGVRVEDFISAAVAAIVLGLVNALVKPLITLLTLPITILTLGLFLLVVNAISLSLVSYFTPGFIVTGFFPAVIGSIVLSFVSSFIHGVFENFAE